MKIKKLLFIITCLIILLVPNVVLAAETFTHGDYTYTIEKAKLKTDTLPKDAEFLEISEDGYCIYHSDYYEEYYKVNEKECIKFTAQEILDFNNKSFNTYYTIDTIENQYDFYEETPAYLYRMGYIKTIDTEIKPNTTYWEAIEVSESGEIVGFGSVLNPDKSKLDQYYEEINLRFPTSTEIDDETVYFQRNNITKIYEKVENPIPENVGKYFIRVDDVSNAIIKKKIGTLNKTAFEKIYENYYFWGIQKDQVTNEFIVLVTNGRDMAVYTTEGELVGEFKGYEPITFSAYSNSLFGIKNEDESFKILDKNMNVIFESENLPILHEWSYANNTYNFVYFDGNGGMEHYIMTMKQNEKDDDTDTDIGNDKDDSTSNNGGAVDSDKDDTSSSGIGSVDKEESLPSTGDNVNKEESNKDENVNKDEHSNKDENANKEENKDENVNASNKKEEITQKPSEEEKDNTPKTGSIETNNTLLIVGFIVTIIASAFTIKK